MTQVIAYGVFAMTHNDGTVLNEWLESFDAEANDGMGHAMFTTREDLAMRFESQNDALAYLLTVPASRPFRADGKPNRPLRAFEVLIRELPAAP